jgi:hypothetical protein
MKSLKLLFLIFWFISCSKKSDSDPLISFRTRTSRLIGKWEITQYSYFDGKIAGTNGNGDPTIIRIEISKNGDWHSYDEKWSNSEYVGQWNWVSKQTKSEKETALVLGYQKSSVPFAIYHYLEKLTYQNIRSKEYYDMSDTRKYLIYEWKRHE